MHTVNSKDIIQSQIVIINRLKQGERQSYRFVVKKIYLYFQSFYINFICMRKSFCLDSVSTAKQISLSPLNSSQSKQLFSFSKQSRFKLKSPYCDSIYNIPSMFRKTGAGIGYGKKSDFTKDLTCSPGSSRYLINTIFDRNTKSKKGFSMYESREKIPSRGHIPLEPLKFPSPSKYENMPPSKSPVYTMRKKLTVINKTMSIEPQNNNPGAGRYENPEALSPRGKYSLSKHHGTGATVFSPRSSVRFFQFQNQNPGPGKYEEVNKLSDKGKYTISRMTGFGKRFFDKEKRVVAFEQKAKKNYIPGPGSYRAPSDFGHYDGNVYANSGAMAYLEGGNSQKSLGAKTKSRIDF